MSTKNTTNNTANGRNIASEIAYLTRALKAPSLKPTTSKIHNHQEGSRFNRNSGVDTQPELTSGETRTRDNLGESRRWLEAQPKSGIAEGLVERDRRDQGALVGPVDGRCVSPRRRTHHVAWHAALPIEALQPKFVEPWFEHLDPGLSNWPPVCRQSSTVLQGYRVRQREKEGSHEFTWVDDHPLTVVSHVHGTHSDKGRVAVLGGRVLA